MPIPEQFMVVLDQLNYRILKARKEINEASEARDSVIELLKKSGIINLDDVSGLCTIIVNEEDKKT